MRRLPPRPPARKRRPARQTMSTTPCGRWMTKRTTLRTLTSTTTRSFPRASQLAISACACQTTHAALHTLAPVAARAASRGMLSCGPSLGHAHLSLTKG